MENSGQNSQPQSPVCDAQCEGKDDSLHKDILCEVRVDTGSKYLALTPSSLNLKEKDWCVIRKEKVMDYGQIVKIFKCAHLPKVKQTAEESVPNVDRKATMQDQSKANENLMRAKSALRTAAQYIQNLNLPMKLLNAHYSLDMKLATFQFSAPGRVDFRELVKQLSHGLNTRVELRQIGVRDETALLGGFGVCGEILCCCRFIREFAPINVRMAKEQDLALNPANISGICNRLKCCLKYEHKGYLELEKGMPRRGAFCDCAEGRGRVVDRNLLARKVSIQLEDTGKTISCPVEETRLVYLEKYKMQGAPEAADLFEGLNEEEAKALKELEE
jgi:cell fate regulator YaaT (PSP1 superfamily)